MKEIWRNGTVFSGTRGKDSVVNFAENVTILGGAGDDYLENQGPKAWIEGNDGNDIIRISPKGKGSTIVAGAGNDSVSNNGALVVIDGAAGNDSLVNYAENVTIAGGKGNDFIRSYKGEAVYQYASGDGNDTIEGFDGNSVLFLASGKVDKYLFKGNDLVLKVGAGSITLKDMKNHYVNMLDASGKFTSKYYGTGYSDLKVIQNFMQTVSESPLKGKASLDEAVKASSSYGSFAAVVNSMVKDCQRAGNAETFLQKYCGISLSNKDTGAITGWEAGGRDMKTWESMASQGAKLSYPTGTTFTRRGLTVKIPQKSSLTKQQQQVVEGLYSCWLDPALDLIEKSYGFSFQKKPRTISLTFCNDSHEKWAGDTGSKEMRINMANVSFTASGAGWQAVRFFAHEFTHVAQYAYGLDDNLPRYLIEGMADLTAGSNKNLLNVAANPQALKNYLYSNESKYKGDEGYAAGYIFWRYLAKQAADTYDKSVAHPWDNSVLINGTKGNDLLAAKGNNVTLAGGNGLDTMTAYGVADSLSGGAGNDYLFVGKSANKVTLVGGAGNDTFAYASGTGKDVIWDYEAGKDTIKLTDGTLGGKKASGKNVILTVGSGSLTLRNAVGKKITVVDAKGKKSIVGPLVNPLPKTAKYVDKQQTQVSLGAAYASTSFDASLYATGIKTVDASKTAKGITLYGNGNANVIKAGSVGSKLYGQNGNDNLLGGKGHDCLYGGNGNDTLKGGAGNDSLHGGKGDDILYGGAGKDIYLYSNGDGNDKILDYSSAEMIKVMTGRVSDMYASQKHKVGTGYVQDVVLTVGTGSIMLKDVACNSKFNIMDANGSKKTYAVSSLKKNI